MIKCKICGHEFEPVIHDHYVSRDCSKAGLVVCISDNEPTFYDSFDCPICGCQVIVQERKREVFGYREEEEYEACEEADNDGENQSS